MTKSAESMLNDITILIISNLLLFEQLYISFELLDLLLLQQILILLFIPAIFNGLYSKSLRSIVFFFSCTFWQVGAFEKRYAYIQKCN